MHVGHSYIVGVWISIMDCKIDRAVFSCFFINYHHWPIWPSIFIYFFIHFQAIARIRTGSKSVLEVKSSSEMRGVGGWEQSKGTIGFFSVLCSPPVQTMAYRRICIYLGPFRRCLILHTDPRFAQAQNSVNNRQFCTTSNNGKRLIFNYVARDC